MSINNEISIIEELSHLKLQVYQNVSAKKSFKEVFFKMPKVSKKEEVDLLLILTLVMSLLESFYRRASLDIGFYIYVLGQSNSLKTTLSHYFTKFLDRLNFRRVMASLKTDTSAALDYKMSLYQDCPLVIDDYFPGADINEANSIKQKVSLITRKSSERLPSVRMTGNTKKQPSLPAKGVYIITGEDRFPEESNLTRSITIELEPSDINWDIFNKGLDKILMLPTFIFSFRDYISLNGHELPQYLKDHFYQFRKHYVDKYGVSYARMSEIYAYLLTSLNFVLEYGISVDAITLSEAREMFEKVEKYIVEAISRQLNAVVSYSPLTIFNKVVSEGILMKKLKLSPIKTNPASVIDGWEDDECYYFMENHLYSFIQRECRNQKINFPLTKDELFKRLASEKLGIIKSERSKQKDGTVSYRYDVKKTVYENYRPRLICILKEKLVFMNEEE